MLHGYRQFVLWNVWLSPFNERNPHSCRWRFFEARTHENCRQKPDEGEDDVKSSWPLWTGLHTCYNGDHNGMQWCESEQIFKSRLSSDCSLQLENMKLESLVICRSARCGEYVNWPCTHRPSSPGSRLNPKYTCFFFYFFSAS